ncbi:transposase [Actinoplanes sp. NPDC024001]|uniref:transposase n=1 Tax=Actinoplanes sp. NPDC024001 TaxID=3154598 RepID=UPI0033E97028
MSFNREYHPSFLEAFAGSTTNLATRSARAVLAIASTPSAGARLTKARIAAALRRAGRQRGIDTAAADLKQALRRSQLRQPPLVEQAMGVQAVALLATLNTACDNVDRLAEAVTAALHQHPDYEILVSFPGLSETGAARVLAEIGDDRARFSDARALKAYAGSAPVTRASGRSISITHRRIKNDRLAAAGFVWSFMAITNHPPARGQGQPHARRPTGSDHP